MATTTPRERVASAPSHAEGAAVRRRRLPVFLNWLRTAVPTGLVIACIGGLAYWGHSTDWTIPKFSALVGTDSSKVDDWCKEHNVPESACIECKPELLPALRDHGWCKVHGVAQCPLEHPELAQLKETPEISEAALQRTSLALSVQPRSENNSRCILYKRRIQFESAEAIQKVGIDIALAQEKPVVEAIVANGEVVYDQTRRANPKARVAGTVWRVEKRIGDPVRKGDVLALIDAADVGKAKSELLQAITQLRLRQTNVERLRPLSQSVAISNRQFREAEATLQESLIRLQGAHQALVNLDIPANAEEFNDVPTEEIASRIQFLGLPENVLATIDAASTTANLLPLRSTLDGVVADCHVVEGAVIDTSTELFDLVDVCQMWLTLDVRQEDAKYVSRGQSVLFRPNDAKGDPEIAGNVAWISTEANDETRTVKIRVNLPNPEGRLRANTFGTGRIVLREEPKAVLVPTEAVHWDGSCNIVFVRDKNYFRPKSPKFFHVRSVRLGVKDGDATEIVAGLLPGEVVASKNSVLLEAQLLKNNLGAGCCEVHSK